MWNNYFRPRRDIPQVNYAESSTDDDEEHFVSPRRPLQTKEGSPAELAVPTLNDNVDEELNQVRQALQNVGHTPIFKRSPPGSPAEVKQEETVSGFVFGGAAGRKLNAPPSPPPGGARWGASPTPQLTHTPTYPPFRHPIPPSPSPPPTSSSPSSSPWWW